MRAFISTLVVLLALYGLQLVQGLVGMSRDSPGVGRSSDRGELPPSKEL